MGLDGGVVVTNPIPEQYAMAPNYITTAMELALAESVKQGVTGKAITPFLLARVNELTDGDSLEANVQLVLNNARLAVQIARAYCDEAA